jgi:hypothetical protein
MRSVRVSFLGEQGHAATPRCPPPRPSHPHLPPHAQLHDLLRKSGCCGGICWRDLTALARPRGGWAGMWGALWGLRRRFSLSAPSPHLEVASGSCSGDDGSSSLFRALEGLQVDGCTEMASDGGPPKAGKVSAKATAATMSDSIFAPIHVRIDAAPWTAIVECTAPTLRMKGAVSFVFPCRALSAGDVPASAVKGPGAGRACLLVLGLHEAARSNPRFYFPEDTFGSELEGAENGETGTFCLPVLATTRSLECPKRLLELVEGSLYARADDRDVRSVLCDSARGVPRCLRAILYDYEGWKALPQMTAADWVVCARRDLLRGAGEALKAVDGAGLEYGRLHTADVHVQVHRADGAPPVEAAASHCDSDAPRVALAQVGLARPVCTLSQRDPKYWEEYDAESRTDRAGGNVVALAKVAYFLATGQDWKAPSRLAPTLPPSLLPVLRRMVSNDDDSSSICTIDEALDALLPLF